MQIEILRNIEDDILSILKSKPLAVVKTLFADAEIAALQDYSNIVSVDRLLYNDHGAYHMRRVLKNAIIIANLLHDKGVLLNIEKENAGDFDDGLVALCVAAFIHDIGMCVSRDDHEKHSVTLGAPIIERILSTYYCDDVRKKVAVKSLILEAILGHMRSLKISSVEAGIILVADGCDCEKGRARIPHDRDSVGKNGDIHMYSSEAVESIEISEGKERSIKINVVMSASVGFFQVEEVLLPKINSSTIKDHIELYASQIGKIPKKYL
ncbi:MAG TPA: HD domain-containing protein [Spirochaetota bacterium]|jgi:hypothetical protein|nr:MAG: hypothetical protein BWX91_00570 [Spirochaetes bacterium ADurb.Bin133]HNZ28224.1 HD domain-containing protein [Spirochaetota bacterium]HPY87559.1 HD domain-containing protein [Spirochaetota bacterium]HQB60201.1 HD domain-containing protein [Spirochaetota bacterium]